MIDTCRRHSFDGVTSPLYNEDSYPSACAKGVLTAYLDTHSPFYSVYRVYRDPTETPQSATLETLKEPLNGLTVVGSQPSQFSENMFLMSHSKYKVPLLAVAAILIVVGVYTFYQTNSRGECGIRYQASLIPSANYFIETVYAATDARLGGHPIDSGYSPEMLAQTYPGFEPSDFNCADAYQGWYIVKDGYIDFHSTAGNRVSTAEKGLTPYGMGDVLENTAKRLGLPFSTNAGVDVILAQIASGN